VCVCVLYTREEFIISSEGYQDSFVAFNVSRATAIRSKRELGSALTALQ